MEIEVKNLQEQSLMVRRNRLAMIAVTWTDKFCSLQLRLYLDGVVFRQSKVDIVFAREDKHTKQVELVGRVVQDPRGCRQRQINVCTVY